MSLNNVHTTKYMIPNNDSLDSIRSKIQFGLKKAFNTQYFLIATTGGILIKMVHLVLY